MSLAQILRSKGCPLDGDELWSLLAEATAALKQCSAQRLASLRLSPETIIFDGRGGVLFDPQANAAGIITDDAAMFIAPERTKVGKLSTRQALEKCQVYALGVVVFFSADAGLSPDVEPFIPNELENVVALMVSHNAADRPGIDAIYSACRRQAAQYRNGLRQFKAFLMGAASAKRGPPSLEHQQQSVRYEQQQQQGVAPSRSPKVVGGVGGGVVHSMTVRLLDNSTLRIPFKGTTTVDEVYRHVIRHCNVAEEGASFFGLSTTGQDGAPIFLPMASLVSEHVSATSMLDFRVEFYVENVSVLKKQWRMRHQMFLQVLRDLTSGYTAPGVDVSKAQKLAGLALQAKMGDFSVGRHQPGYFKLKEIFTPRLDPRMTANANLEAVLADMHKQHRGLGKDEAEDRFLRIAQTLPEFGITFHLVSRTKFKSKRKATRRGKSGGVGGALEPALWLGGSPRGILLFEEINGSKSKRESLAWNAIRELNQTGVKVTIKTKPGNKDGGKVQNIVVFAPDARSAEMVYNRLQSLHQFWDLIQKQFKHIENPLATSPTGGIPVQQSGTRFSDVPLLSDMVGGGSSRDVGVQRSQQQQQQHQQQQQQRTMDPAVAPVGSGSNNLGGGRQQYDPRSPRSQKVGSARPTSPGSFTDPLQGSPSKRPASIDGGSVNSAADARAETRQALESSQLAGRSMLGAPGTPGKLSSLDEGAVERPGRYGSGGNALGLSNASFGSPGGNTTLPTTSPGGQQYRYREERSITLHKVARGWGFSIVGTDDPQEGRNVNLATKVVPGLPAERAGLRNNDRIIAMNDVNVVDYDRLDLVRMIQDQNTISLVVKQRKKVKLRSAVGGNSAPASPERPRGTSGGAGTGTGGAGKIDADADQRAAMEAMAQLQALNLKMLPSPARNSNTQQPPQQQQQQQQHHNLGAAGGEVETIILEKGTRGLGVKLSEIAAQIFIDEVMPGSAADTGQRLRAGDQILSADGNDLTMISLADATKVISSTGRSVKMVVKHQSDADWQRMNAQVRLGSIRSTAEHATGIGAPPVQAPPALSPLPPLPEGDVFEFTLTKTAPSETFGFVFTGGRKKTKPGKKAKKPKRVQVDNVLENTIASTAGVQIGDCLLSINGREMVDPSHDDVIRLMKSSDTLHLQVIRPAFGTAEATRAGRLQRQSATSVEGVTDGLSPDLLAGAGVPAAGRPLPPRPLPTPPTPTVASISTAASLPPGTVGYFTTRLEKGDQKLGMTLEGGEDPATGSLTPIRVKKVKPGSPGEAAGVAAGDLIVEFKPDGAGAKVDLVVGLSRSAIIELMKANPAFHLTILRGLTGTTAVEDLELARAPSETSWGMMVQASSSNVTGAPLKVQAIKQPSVAQRCGLFEEDLLVAFGDMNLIGMALHDFNTELKNAGGAIILRAIRETAVQPGVRQRHVSRQQSMAVHMPRQDTRRLSNLNTVVADPRITAELGNNASATAVDMLRRLSASLGGAMRNNVPAGEWNQLLQQRQSYGHDFELSQSFCETNPKKNRYVDILSHEGTRVKLAASRDAPDDYINANEFVLSTCSGSALPAILAQGPLPQTVFDFWRMVVLRRVPVIAMVTSVEENGRQKCHKYWPELNETMPVGPFSITCVDFKDLGHSVLSRLVVKANGSVIHETEHIRFKAWPDHGVPEDPTDFLELVAETRALIWGKDGPIVLHCSAGVGRSGVLTAMLYIREELGRLVTRETPESLQTKGADIAVLPIFKIVTDMRRSRNQYVVQTMAQYEFLFAATQRLAEVFVRSIAVSEPLARTSIEGTVHSAVDDPAPGPPPLVPASEVGLGPADVEAARLALLRQEAEARRAAAEAAARREAEQKQSADEAAALAAVAAASAAASAAAATITPNNPFSNEISDGPLEPNNPFSSFGAAPPTRSESGVTQPDPPAPAPASAHILVPAPAPAPAPAAVTDAELEQSGPAVKATPAELARAKREAKKAARALAAAADAVFGDVGAPSPQATQQEPDEPDALVLGSFGVGEPTPAPEAEATPAGGAGAGTGSSGDKVEDDDIDFSDDDHLLPDDDTAPPPPPPASGPPADGGGLDADADDTTTHASGSAECGPQKSAAEIARDKRNSKKSASELAREKRAAKKAAKEAANEAALAEAARATLLSLQLPEDDDDEML